MTELAKRADLLSIQVVYRCEAMGNRRVNEY